VPFIPNPPWEIVGAFGAAGQWADIAWNNATSSVSQCQYYRDMFGNVHLSGTFENAALRPVNVWNPIITLTGVSWQPDRTRYFPGMSTYPTSEGHEPVWIRTRATGLTTQVELYFFSTVVANIPISTDFILDLVWETT